MMTRHNQDSLQQDICPIEAILPFGELARRMAPVLGRDEDHAGRADRSEHLGIVPGARREGLRAEA